MSVPLAVLLLLTAVGSMFIFSLPAVFATNPACGATITANTTLTGNIGPCSGDGLIIGKSGIILNCGGHTITGTGGYDGITLNGLTKVTVEKCKVKGFDYGFLLEISSSTHLTGNTANNNGYGFYLSSSPSNTLTGNTANSNTDNGFLISGSGSNHLTKNTANANGVGFHLSGSSSNTLTGNIANNNVEYGYYDNSVSSSPGFPHWNTANSYGTTVAKLSTTGDKGTGNGALAGGNPNISTATSPF